MQRQLNIKFIPELNAHVIKEDLSAFDPSILTNRQLIYVYHDTLTVIHTHQMEPNKDERILSEDGYERLKIIVSRCELELSDRGFPLTAH